MPEFLPGSVFSGILTVAFVIVQRVRAGKSRLSLWKLVLIGIAAAFVIPWALALAANIWRATPGLPALPVITFDQVFIGALVALAMLGIGYRPGRRPPVPLWAGLLTGVAFALLLPPFLDLVTGSYQRPSLRSDINHCTRGMTGQSQPREVVNICDEPIAVGLCLPGETNPAPCAQTNILQPGQTARFDPGGAQVSSLPSNPNGLTVVACRPPARPSRMQTTMGRGYEGVCLPPG
ncbi:MAG: hypothetical protein AB7S93_16250 [Xanthobacteraceae bacterium]